MLPDGRRWQVYFLGISKSGWSAGAQNFAARVKAAGAGEENWDCAGMHLLDFVQVDRDLAEWV
jgi:hypothetical protein